MKINKYMRTNKQIIIIKINGTRNSNLGRLKYIYKCINN